MPRFTSGETAKAIATISREGILKQTHDACARLSEVPFSADDSAANLRDELNSAEGYFSSENGT
jgi:hypothetical protein